MSELELKKRTKQCGLRVMKLVGALPAHSVGQAIAPQLIRSRTSVEANDRSACRGRSKAEFIAKFGVVVEQADESAYCLELIVEGELLATNLVEPLLQEASELTAIMVASRKSAQSSIKNQKS
jgi:four helix bundle protein